MSVSNCEKFLGNKKSFKNGIYLPAFFNLRLLNMRKKKVINCFFYLYGSNKIKKNLINLFRKLCNFK